MPVETGIQHFPLDSRPFDRLRAVSRFDRLTTLSWRKGLPNGFRGNDGIEASFPETNL